MKDPQLIELIKTLSEKEIEDLRKFLVQPAYNSSPTVSKLFSILIKFYPVFSLSEYSKEKVFSVLIPGEKYNNLLLNEYYHLLSNLIIKFIKKSVLDKNEIHINIKLLNEYSKRGLKKQFDKLFIKIESKLKEEKFDHNILNLFFALQEARINSRNAFGTENKTMKEIKDEYNLYLTYLINIVVSEYLTLQLINSNESHTYNIGEDDLYKRIQEDKIIPKLYGYIKDVNPFDFNIQLHFSMMDMLSRQEDTSKYYQNKNLLMENFDKFTNIKLDNQINYLKSYCLKKVYSPDTRKEFLKEYIEMEFLILNGKLFANEETNYLKNISFRNLLMMLSELKETERIGELISFANYLRPETRNDYKFLANAYYSFHSENYSEAEIFLNKIITGDKLLSLDVNFLRLKIYFEENNSLKGIDKINSVRRMINYDSDIHKDRKNKYRVFLNYLEKMFKRSEKNDETGVYLILKEIMGKENIIFYEWFEEIFEKMKDGKKIKRQRI